SVLQKQHTAESRLAWAVILCTIPAGLAGLIVGDYIDANLRSALVIALTTVLFGLLLGVSDVTGQRERDEYALRWRDVLIIGLGQASALIPGTSRSGVTMTLALFMGLTRQAAARFSFLISIPIIFLAGGAKTVELIQQADPVIWGDLLLGVVMSGVSAYLCIRAFISLLDRIGMWPFVIYRLLLGAVLFFWFI
ncbi:MAG: undecaprenyl-diphosphate phosphatase, partial [Pseudomonadota bacterium]